MSEKKNNTWTHRGFEDFSRGRFDNGGDNLYVNANGVIERIRRTDLNNDGYVDLVLPNSHGYIERGPTWIYTRGEGKDKDWRRHELPNDSGWLSRIEDVDVEVQPPHLIRHFGYGSAVPDASIIDQLCDRPMALRQVGD